MYVTIKSMHALETSSNFDGMMAGQADSTGGQPSIIIQENTGKAFLNFENLCSYNKIDMERYWDCSTHWPRPYVAHPMDL